MSDEGSFLARWSQRKREALARPTDEPQPLEGENAQAPAEADAEPFDLSSLPDLESLTAQSDISAFLHKAVPDALRNAALRKVWMTDPAIRDYVGEALDYAWDWNKPGGVPGFGEILANDQTAAFVRNLLAGPSEHANVNDGSGAQQAAAQSSPEANEPRGPAGETPAQAPENAELAGKAPELSAQPPEASPPLRKPRHGGALPV